MGSEADSVRVRVRTRSQRIPHRIRAGLRFETAWREVEVTPEQLAQLKADPHLVVAELRVGERIKRALSLEEAQRRTGDPWEVVDQLLGKVAELEAMLAARPAHPTPADGDSGAPAAPGPQASEGVKAEAPPAAPPPAPAAPAPAQPAPVPAAAPAAPQAPAKGKAKG